MKISVPLFWVFYTLRIAERTKCGGHVHAFYLCVKEDVIEINLSRYNEMDLLLKCLKTKYTEYALKMPGNWI